MSARGNGGTPTFDKKSEKHPKVCTKRADPLGKRFRRPGLVIAPPKERLSA